MKFAIKESVEQQTFGSLRIGEMFLHMSIKQPYIKILSDAAWRVGCGVTNFSGFAEVKRFCRIYYDEMEDTLFLEVYK